MATASVTNTLVNATTISVGPLNTNFTDLVTFLNNSVVHRDGSKALTAALPMGGFKITGLGTPTASTDAATKAYADLKATIAHSHTSSEISALDAADTTSGTFGIARIPTGTSSSTVSLGNHTHATYLLLTGGSLTGRLNVEEDGDVAARFYRSDTSGGLVTFSSDAGGTETQKSFIDSADGDLTLSSDERMKENIVDAPRAARVRDVRVRRFNWKGEGGDSLGVVAQELATVFPEAVVEQGGVLSVKPTKLIWLLIQAVQELEARVDALEARA